jgi:hypothetical protein
MSYDGLGVINVRFAGYRSCWADVRGGARAGMTQAAGSASYRESRSLVPPPIAWAVLAVAVYTAGRVAWNWRHGQSDLVLSVPGLLALLAIGVGAVVAKQNVRVTTAEILVGHSPRMSRRIGLTELERAEVREHPPSRYRLSWPFAKVRVYSLDRGTGVLLTLAGGELVFIGTRQPQAMVRAISDAAPHVVRTHVWNPGAAQHLSGPRVSSRDTSVVRPRSRR